MGENTVIMASCAMPASSAESPRDGRKSWGKVTKTMSKQSDRVIENLLDANPDGVAWAEAVEAVSDKCDVKENTAETYIRRSDKAATEVDLDGNKVIVDPASNVDSETVVHNEGEVLEMEVGEPTSSKFGGLVRLEDVGHPLVPTAHKDGYFRRRVVASKTDVQVVTGALADSDYSVLLEGEAGVGKDRLLLHIAANTNRPVIRLTASDDPDFVDLLIGHYNPNEEGNFERKKGLLSLSIEHGYTFILDEVNMLSGKVQSMLNMILEDADQSQLVIPETNEVIEPHPEFKFCATQNPPKMGYGGTEELNQAFESRFFKISLPPVDSRAEREIVAAETDWEADDPAVDNLLREDGGVVTSLRTLYESGKTSTWVSTRDVIKIGRMASTLGDAEAATELLLTGIADYADEEAVRSAINDQRW